MAPYLSGAYCFAEFTTSDDAVPFVRTRYLLFAHIALLGRLHVACACFLDNRPTPRIRARRYAPRPARARVGDKKSSLQMVPAVGKCCFIEHALHTLHGQVDTTLQ